MEHYLILAKAHGGFAMLLFALAFVSLLLAALSTATKKVPGFANIAGLVETIVAGVVTLSGLVVMFVGPYPLSQIWLWLGLVIAVIYSVVLKRVVKPARLESQQSGEGAGKWLAGQLGLFVLVIAAFGLMKLKAF